MVEHTVRELIWKAKNVNRSRVQYMEDTVSGVRMGHVQLPVVLVKERGFDFAITLPLHMEVASVVTLVTLKKQHHATSGGVLLMVATQTGCLLVTVLRHVEQVKNEEYVFVHVLPLLLVGSHALDVIWK